MTHPALFYSKIRDNGVQCRLCAHQCRVMPGRRGLCAVRENRDGELVSLVYGSVAALAMDPIEKKPLFHFLPGTQTLSLAAPGCNFKCAFCQNASLSQIARVPEYGRSTAPEEIVAAAEREGARSIAYTYSEPTVFFEFAYDIGKLARAKGFKNIFVTNGFLSEETQPFVSEFLDAANVDLKCFSDATYAKVMGGALQPVLETIKRFFRAGIHIEVTTLVVPGLNDSDAELRAIAEFLAAVSPDIPWHVSRFHPDYRMQDRSGTPADTVFKAVEIGRAAGLRYVYAGNLPGRGGEDTFCPGCGSRIIERHGFRVLENKIRNNACSHCGKSVFGLFD